jgi:hypothetical protein
VIATALVAGRLGMDTALAGELVAGTRRRLGRRRFAVRAVAFALATSPPFDRLLPARLRRLAIIGLVRPLLADPPQRLAYLLGQSTVIPCGGLLSHS